jgi:membrane dipeptidase
MTDIPRLRQGGVGAMFWSVYVPASLAGPEAVRATIEQVDLFFEAMRRYPDAFEPALSADDVERASEAGKIASLIGIEGGHSIDSSLSILRMLHRLGARYMTLTHSSSTPWADAAGQPPEHGGLSPKGEQVVSEMNRLGMIVDLSHVSPETMEGALRVTRAPVIFSHSSARAVCDVPRNVPDNVLEMLPENGGVVMVTFVAEFISGRKNGEPGSGATVSRVADHIDHIKRVAGIDHIGIGSDFDGATKLPVGLEDVSKFPALTVELLKRGYSDEEIKKILRLNVIRVMREAERVSKEPK